MAAARRVRLLRYSFRRWLACQCSCISQFRVQCHATHVAISDLIVLSHECSTCTIDHRRFNSSQLAHLGCLLFCVSCFFRSWSFNHSRSKSRHTCTGGSSALECVIPRLSYLPCVVHFDDVARIRNASATQATAEYCSMLVFCSHCGSVVHF